MAGCNARSCTSSQLKWNAEALSKPTRDVSLFNSEPSCFATYPHHNAIASAIHLLQVVGIGLIGAVLAVPKTACGVPDVLDTLAPLHSEALAYDDPRGRLIAFGGRTPDDWLPR